MRSLKVFILSLFVTAVCSCKKSPTYQGKYQDAAVPEARYKVELISVEIVNFSFSSSAYFNNDNGTGPDIYFQFYTSSTGGGKLPTHSYSQVFNDMQISDLPFKFVFIKPILLVSSTSLLKLSSAKQSFDDLFVRTGNLSANPIIVMDYDGPPTFSQLTIYNQTLTSYDMGNFIFRPGTNKVLTETGDAIIEYKITSL